MDNTINDETIFSEIYENICNNTNYLRNTFLKDNSEKDLRLILGDKVYENLVAKKKTEIPVELLATKIGMTKQSVYHTLHQERLPSFQKIFTLSQFFNVPLEDFIFKNLQNETTSTYITKSNKTKGTLQLSDNAVELVNSINEKLVTMSDSELQSVLNFVNETTKDNNKDEVTYKSNKK